MTRLAVEHGAVNLSQGFTDEAPVYPIVWSAIATLLGGTPDGVARLDTLEAGEVGARGGSLRSALERYQSPRDRFNQYSFPFGLGELRTAIADYTHRWYGVRPDPEREVTVTLGATEGLASVLAGVAEPGDTLIVPQPCHEMYPSQAELFRLKTRYVTLRERDGGWCLDLDELSRAANGARLLILNTPHNPTGKVFTPDELEAVAAVARAHDLIVVTDEIYEHITFAPARHHALTCVDDMRDRTIVVNSISKTGNATGWRVGWVIAPAGLTERIRAVHDTLVVQAPTPLQRATIHLLEQPDAFYDGLRRRYTEKRDRLAAGLVNAGFRMTTPEGAYYLFADYAAVDTLRGLSATDAAMWLIEHAGVASVPGDNFYRVGDAGGRYLRFAFCRSLETLDEATRRLARMAAS